MKYHVEFDIDFKRNDTKGFFVAIEGIDGSGKTTQAKKIKEELEKTQNVFLTKNPTVGQIGQFIRKILSKEIKVPSVAFQYLFSADRQVQQEGILSHLEKGETVITDRYFWSALAYGMVDRGVIEKDTLQLLKVSQGILSMYHQFMIPDVTFYLDISVDVAMNRLSSMGKEKELYEEREELEKIDRAYSFLMSEFPKEFTVIDGEQSIDDVSIEIFDKIRNIKK